MYKVNVIGQEMFPVEIEGAKDVQIQLLLDENNGASNFTMRRFAIQPGGHTPHHEHEWEHEVFVLAGRGELKLENGFEPIAPGDAILVPPGIGHSFHNTGSETLEFLCLVPNGPATRG